MNTRIVILAAGMGSRMGADVPKALVPVGGKPILQHLIDSINRSGVDVQPVVVIGHERDQLCEAFGNECAYVVQEEQLGTGHAVMVTEEEVMDSDAVIVLYGDHPFVSQQTLRSLHEKHHGEGNTITMMTVDLPHFNGWHKVFAHWGRILRDEAGKIVGIREHKDANDEERTINEVNPSLFCFDGQWLWENIHNIKDNNAQGEYYLTDLIAMAFEQQQPIATMCVAPEEAIGINTPEELEIAEDILLSRGE
jgi:bifunctional UDP-N-acetylglucosamine pyrophosphorylase/glucosamine-1-phosphate N-acetyltransferase